MFNSSYHHTWLSFFYFSFSFHSLHHYFFLQQVFPNSKIPNFHTPTISIDSHSHIQSHFHTAQHTWFIILIGLFILLICGNDKFYTNHRTCHVYLSQPGLGWLYVFSPFPLLRNGTAYWHGMTIMTMMLTRVTMVGWADVPDIDRGNFRLWCAVDISTFTTLC